MYLQSDIDGKKFVKNCSRNHQGSQLNLIKEGFLLHSRIFYSNQGIQNHQVLKLLYSLVSMKR